jgi:hypothetical protein
VLPAIVGVLFPIGDERSGCRDVDPSEVKVLVYAARRDSTAAADLPTERVEAAADPEVVRGPVLKLQAICQNTRDSEATTGLLGNLPCGPASSECLESQAFYQNRPS